jgi:hypothetical protein
MRVRVLLSCILCLVLVAPVVALAQQPAQGQPQQQQKVKAQEDNKDKNRDYFCVYMGGAFGGNMFGNGSLGNPLTGLSRGTPKTYGVAVGFWGPGVLSGELDLGYYPQFFGPSNNPSLGANSLYNITGSLVLHPKSFDFGTQRIRPYALIGGGLMRARVEDFIKFYSSDTRNWGVVDLGAGIQYYPVRQFGVRVDLRYFRAVGANGSTQGWGWINKWDWFRTTVGAAITF